MTVAETSVGPRTAADWRARLESGDAAEADFVAFTAWLEESPANRAAVDRLDTVLTELAAHKEHLAGDKVVRLPLWKKPLFAGAAVAAIAASILAVFLVTRTSFDVGRETTWATHTGERKDVTLADGSVIHMNTATRVSVAFDGGARNARLDTGEALFEVSPDPKRPFTVAAGDQRINVVGTAFNVLRHDGSVAVTVSHGIVRATAPGAEPARLTAGNHYVRREGDTTFAVTTVDTATTIAWREGRLAYDNAELSKVVSDLNRNFETQISLADPSLRSLRFTGVLKLDSAEAVARRLEGFLPIAATPQGNGIVLRALLQK